MNKAILLLYALLIATPVFANETAIQQQIIHNGIGMGSVLAIVTSWSRNNSVLWAFLHGILGWLYVLYFVITRESK